MSFLLDGDSRLAGEGGSQGVWVLQIEDLAPNANRWDTRSGRCWGGWVQRVRCWA